MSIDPKRLGERMRAAREAAGVTQEDVARAVSGPLERSVTSLTISKYELGKVPNPDLRLVAAVADHFRVPIDELVHGAPATVTERDDGISPYPEVEQLIADEAEAGRAIGEDHLAELRGLRLYRKTVASLYDTAVQLLAQLRAGERGRKLPRRPVRR